MSDSFIRAKNPLVLFVDDDPVIRALYGQALRSASLEVEEAASMREALDVLRRVRPDLVVLDRQLPDGDGWEIARAMRASAAHTDVPILAFTSEGHSRANVEAALIAGCDFSLEKPCAPSELVRHAVGLLDVPLAPPSETGLG